LLYNDCYICFSVLKINAKKLKSADQTPNYFLDGNSYDHFFGDISKISSQNIEVKVRYQIGEWDLYLSAINLA
jgi:hypothetical protein